MKVVKEVKNDLLKRKEVQILVESSGNPGLASSLKTVADKFKVSEDLVAVKQLKGKFGRDTFLIKANIYETKQNKDLIEPKLKIKKENK